MKLTYDPDNNVAYLHLKHDVQVSETKRVSDDLNVDVAADGIIVGIEFLDANQQLGLSTGFRLVVVNEADGFESSLDLSIGRPSAKGRRAVR